MAPSSEVDDDISSLNSDFVQPRFGRKKLNGSSGSSSVTETSEESSEMEAFSEDEEINEIIRRHSVR